MKLFLICCVAFCTFFDVAMSIRGNNVRDAKKDEFPYVVSIGRKHKIAKQHPELTHYCTGSLITRQHVLSAEHCFDGEEPNNTYILYGSIDLTKAKKYNVQKWITYKMWQLQNGGRVSFMPHDIAIVTLKKKITDTKLKPITPLKFITPDFESTYAISAGWGRGNDGNKPQILKVARFQIVSNDKCEDRLAELTGEDKYLHSRFFCSHADPWTLLDCGDSGGPVIRGNFLIGINLGSCPQDDEVLQLSRHLLDEKQMNMHLGFHYYRDFIKSITEV